MGFIINNILNLYNKKNWDYNFILSYLCPFFAIRILLAFKNMLDRLPHFPIFLCSWGLFVLEIVHYDFSVKSSGFDIF